MGWRSSIPGRLLFFIIKISFCQKKWRKGAAVKCQRAFLLSPFRVSLEQGRKFQIYPTFPLSSAKPIFQSCWTWTAWREQRQKVWRNDSSGRKILRLNKKLGHGLRYSYGKRLSSSFHTIFARWPSASPFLTERVLVVEWGAGSASSRDKGWIDLDSNEWGIERSAAISGEFIIFIAKE